MSDLTLKSRPALATVKLGRSGAHAEKPGIMLTALPEGHLLHLLADPKAGDIAPRLGEAVAAIGSSLRTVAPGQWFVVGDSEMTARQLGDFSSSIADWAAVADQSHGRVRIRAEGEPVLSMLAKGIAADLHTESFPVGHATVTLSGHVTVHLMRLDAKVFELTVLRGFAEDLWSSLVHQSLEYGVDCQRAA